MYIAHARYNISKDDIKHTGRSYGDKMTNNKDGQREWKRRLADG